MAGVSRDAGEVRVPTYNQSMRPSLLTNFPGGVGSFKKAVTITSAVPQMGKLRSVWCAHNSTSFCSIRGVTRTYRTAIATARE